MFFELREEIRMRTTLEHKALFSIICAAVFIVAFTYKYGHDILYASGELCQRAKRS
jgi:hypothetical protein